MVSQDPNAAIEDLVHEVTEAAFTNLEGASATLWQQTAEESLYEISKELADELRRKVAREGKQVLLDKAAIKAYLVELLVIMAKRMVEEDFAGPLRAWAQGRS